jgi:MFS family permease
MTTKTGTQVIAWDEWRRHGIMMPACLIGMVLLPIHSYSLGVMIGPLESEFGWSRSEISAGPLVTSLLTLLLAPVAGRALDRYGPRRIALIGIPLFSVALSLISTAGPNIVSWLAMYAVLAVAIMFIFPTVWTGAIAMRFDRNRGLAMAIALSGTGITSAIIPLTASSLMLEYGWRGAYIGLGLISFIVAYPLVIFLFARDDARVVGEARESRPAHEGTFSEYRSLRFVLLAAAGLIYSIGATGLGVNAVPVLMEEGFTLSGAAGIAGLIGVGTIVGRFVGGLLLDLFDGRLVATACGFSAMAAAGVLLATDQSTLGASAACLLLGLAAGAEYDACAYLTTRYFPKRNFGAIFGVVGALAGAGSGFAPMIANAVYDVTGTYELVLWGLIPLFIVASALFLALGKYPAEAELR